MVLSAMLLKVEIMPQRVLPLDSLSQPESSGPLTAIFRTELDRRCPLPEKVVERGFVNAPIVVDRIGDS